MSEPTNSLASRMGPIPGDAPAESPAASAPSDPPSAPAATTTTEPTEPAEAPAAAIAEDDLVKNRYNVAVKLANEQGDPNSPLYSVKRFEDLGLYLPPSSAPSAATLTL